MLKNELKKTFVNNEYELYYQPLVNRHREIVSYEALSRWCTKGEIFSPYYYMDVLEKEGFAETMFFYNIDKLLVDISEGLISHPVAVNAPSFVIEKKKFPRRVLGIFYDKGLDPSLLKIELSEKHPIQNHSLLVENMVSLKKEGVSFSLDDFGTGNTSFLNLKNLPVDEVKIDKIFLEDLHDVGSVSLLEKFSDFIVSLGMSVVIEGVETETQFSQLSNVPYSALQGYLFYKPEPLR